MNNIQFFSLLLHLRLLLSFGCFEEGVNKLIDQGAVTDNTAVLTPGIRQKVHLRCIYIRVINHVCVHSCACQRINTSHVQ